MRGLLRESRFWIDSIDNDGTGAGQNFTDLNLQAIQDEVNPNYSETYHYDELYRLDSAETSVWSLSWVYDRYGNRLSQSGSGGVPTETLTISTTTNRVSGWTYDAAGNVTGDGTHTYAYDAENRLITVDAGVTATYGYGPNGERVWKVAGGVTTYYYWGIGEKVSGSWTKFFVSGLGGKLVEYSSSTTKFFVTNHLGSVAARMDVSGTLSETYRYLPFGELFAGTATTHEFSGKERDQESGLDYFGARYLASSHGRWMSVDPALGNTANPQRLNRYSYVGNAPTSLVDPNGMQWTLVDCGIMENSVKITYETPEEAGSESSWSGGKKYYCIYSWTAEPPPPNPPVPPPTKQQTGETPALKALSFSAMQNIVKANNLSGQSDELILCQAYRESKFRPWAVNGKTGASGLLQILPAAALDIWSGEPGGFGENGFSAETINGWFSPGGRIFQPGFNIATGTAYLGWLISDWSSVGGSVWQALDRYSHGAKGYADQIVSCEQELKEALENGSDPMPVLKKVLPQ